MNDTTPPNREPCYTMGIKRLEELEAMAELHPMSNKASYAEVQQALKDAVAELHALRGALHQHAERERAQRAAFALMAGAFR